MNESVNFIEYVFLLLFGYICNHDGELVNIWFVSICCASPFVDFLLCVGIDVDVFQAHLLLFINRIILNRIILK